jgi:4-carboxymuconolactone decarboxylase
VTISGASRASSASPAAETGVRHTTAILAIILVSYFMILLDNSIIFTALPKIHPAMRFSPAGLAWVQDAYTLVFGGLLLLGARAGDLMGRRLAPKLAELTDDVLFGDVRARPELSPRDRNLVTCAALVTNGSIEQLRGHLGRARQNGLSETELKEMIIHLAFYAGWPRAMSAITPAKELFTEPGGHQ